MGALNERFNRKDKPYALNIANAMWCEQTFPLRQQYIDALNEPYGAAVKPATFKTNPEGERKRINEWVEQQTNNRIKELLAPGLVDSLTRLVLTNAIFFKGDWAVKFKEKQTRDMPFTLADGGKPKVKMMMHTATAKREGAKKGEAPFRYAAFNAKGAPVKGFRDKVSFEVLELPYKGDELSMIVMLPQANGLAKLEKMLSADRVNQWIGNLKRQKVFVMLPRFKMETGYAMNKSLKAMGMPRAFRPLGEFTGLSDSPEAREIYITAVVHKAFVEVNEEGTEAAAATAVVFGGRSAGPRYPSFRADRPFVFMIRDNATGSVLFLGRLMDPTTDE
jgi:serpin B